jgi:hypothetical protein
MILLLIVLKSHINLESLVIAITGYLIVFTALVLLFWLFSMTPRLLTLRRTKKSRRRGESPSGAFSGNISGEETAAIAMALHLYLDELHDQESGVLTIKRISKTYSPWSSKIYAVRNQFNRN